MRSPRRLRDAGDLAHMRALAETDAAQAELPQVTPRAAAQLATVVRAHLELGLELGFLDQTRLRHQAAAPSRRSGIPISSMNATACSSLRAVVTMTMSMPRTISTLS